MPMRGLGEQSKHVRALIEDLGAQVRDKIPDLQAERDAILERLLFADRQLEAAQAIVEIVEKTTTDNSEQTQPDLKVIK